jgi:hypothetical protein
MQAIILCRETHLVLLELLSNSTTINSALQYIHNKRNQIKNNELDATNDLLVTGKQTIF